MAECSTCPKERRAKVERPYRSVPRQVKYTGRGEPAVRERFVHPRQRFSRSQCDSCYVEKEPWESYRPYFDSIYSQGYVCPPPCPCPSPCPENRCCYCPGSSEYGFLSSLRNGFQKIFNGNRKRACAPICNGKVYNYSASQLRAMEQYLCKLEDESSCIDDDIKEAFDCNYRQNCGNLRCSLASISDRLETLRCDLNCASDCYDPCRDKFEFNLICTLVDRSNCLEGFLNDLCLQLECLEYQFGCYRSSCEPDCRKPCCIKRPSCKPNCKKPCCYRSFPYAVPNETFVYNCRPGRRSCDINCEKPVCVKQPCEISCQKPCCVKRPVCDRPRRWRNGNCGKKNNLCRTSSVIPLGVMLVKL